MAQGTETQQFAGVKDFNLQSSEVDRMNFHVDDDRKIGILFKFRLLKYRLRLLRFDFYLWPFLC